MATNAPRKRLALAIGLDWLELLEVQVEGKKRMSADEFLRGNKIQ